jgi:hypothetical protein
MAPVGLLIDNDGEADDDAPLLVSVGDAVPPLALPLVAVVLPVLLCEPPVAAPPVAAPLVAEPPAAPLPPVAVELVGALEVALGFWLSVGLALLVLEFVLLLVLLFVAVLVPVVLLWAPLELGPVAEGPAPLFVSGSTLCASAVAETNSAEIANAIIVRFIPNSLLNDSKLPLERKCCVLAKSGEPGAPSSPNLSAPDYLGPLTA